MSSRDNQVPLRAHPRAPSWLARARWTSLPLTAPSNAVERGRRLRRRLLLSDIASVLLASGVATLLLPLSRFEVGVEQQLLGIAVCLPAFLLLMQTTGLYHQMEQTLDPSFVNELKPVFLVTSSWTLLLMAATAVIADKPVRPVWFITFCILLAVIFLAGRALTRRITSRRPWFRQRTMLLGEPDAVARVARRINRHPEAGLDVQATLPGVALTSPGGPPGPGGDRLPSPDVLISQLRGRGIQRVVLSGWQASLEERTELIRVLVTAGFYVDLVSGEPEALTARGRIHHIEGLPMMTISPARASKVARSVKRGVDLAISLTALLALSPLLAYLALRIKRDSPGPVLFRQPRAGRNGVTFTMLKFRTMVVGADRMRTELREQRHPGELFKLRDDPRTTPFGKRLRARSLDELPQLWNVVRGEMSLVGPRPLPEDEAALVADHFAERGRFRPGITGPWQIYGRSDIPFEDMVKLDYNYVSAWSLEEDLRLLVRTIGAVASGRGAY